MATRLTTWNPPAFRPHPLVRGGHWQTLFPVLFQGEAILEQTVRHTVTLDDGDSIILHDDAHPEWKIGDPAILLMHGLGGCHQSNYLKRAAAKMVSRGWRVFRMDHRGSGAGSGLARRPYHAGRTEDPLAALQFIASQCPGSPLSTIGYSLSGNLILKLIATQQDALPAELHSVVAISPAIDLCRACENIRQPKNRRYDRHFAKLLWNMAPRYDAIKEELGELMARPKQPASVINFDHEVTAPLGGFESADEYYRKCSSQPDLPAIEVPTLILGAADDPLIPVEILREANYSAATELLIAESGGHLGFIGRAGVDPDRRWMDWRIIDWIAHHLGE